MALEIELKFRKPDFDKVRENLRGLGAGFLARYFERNLVLDDASSSLRGKGMLLRLRQAQGRSVLTFKQPPEGLAASQADQADRADQVGQTGLAKVLDEREVEVADFQAMLGILEGLGFRPAFAYEKVREKWRLDGALICLDRLPFGEFVEIEADEAEILRLAAKLDLDLDCATAENYHELHRRHRQETGLPPQDSFVFSNSFDSLDLPSGEAQVFLDP